MFCCTVHTIPANALNSVLTVPVTVQADETSPSCDRVLGVGYGHGVLDAETRLHPSLAGKDSSVGIHHRRCTSASAAKSS